MITKHPILHLFAVLLFLFFVNQACRHSATSHRNDSELLVSVYNKHLYLSDMEGMIPEGMSAEDSALIIDAFIRNWIRETVLLHKAEQNIPRGLNIEKLVADYRATLIKHSYENVVVNDLLDSVITQSELQDFYEKNKEQYQLETPIIRCRFMKIPRQITQPEKLQSWWNNSRTEDLILLKQWCTQNAIVHHLADSVWYKVDDIAAYMPRGTLTVDNVNSRRDFIQRDDNFVYFFKVLELVSKKEIAPLSYIEDQARKVILHKRKMELLENLKDQLLEDALRRKEVQIHWKSRHS